MPGREKREKEALRFHARRTQKITIPQVSVCLSLLPPEWWSTVFLIRVRTEEGWTCQLRCAGMWRNNCNAFTRRAERDRFSHPCRICRTRLFTLPELDSCFGALVFCVLRSRRAFLRASNSSLRQAETSANTEAWHEGGRPI